MRANKETKIEVGKTYEWVFTDPETRETISLGTFKVTGTNDNKAYPFKGINLEAGHEIVLKALIPGAREVKDA